jgi:hypothetical protein
MILCHGLGCLSSAAGPTDRLVMRSPRHAGGSVKVVKVVKCWSVRKEMRGRTRFCETNSAFMGAGPARETSRPDPAV